MALHRHLHQLFGSQKASSNRAGQVLPEALATSGTPYRVVATGPDDGGRYSYQFIPTGTFTATATVWYSNVPNPDPAVAADWWQDTDIGTITFTTGVTQGKPIGNAFVEWVKYEVTVASGTLNLVGYHRTERGI